LINFSDDSEAEKFENMAKELGYDSFSAFVKASMIFNYQFKNSFFNMFSKVDDIFLKLQENVELNVKTQNSISEVSSKIDSYEERLRSLPTDTEIYKIRMSFYEIMRQNASEKWITYTNIVRLMGIENDLSSIKILQNLLDTDFEVKSLVERKKDMFRIRDVALPHEPYELVVRD
jgi:hypothetical protein